MGRKKTPPDDYHALAEKRGFHWLGPEVPTTHTKTGWECEQGHQWKTTFQSIRRGTGCPFCVGQAPKTLDDYHTLAKERGFRWLGPEVPNTNTKTGWECEQDHQWKTTFQSIQQGKSCPFCSGRATRTPDDYHMLAKERGFCWLGPEVPNTNTKTGWECEQGHQWKTTFQSIRRRIGCPFCAGQAPKTPDDYHTLAKERGFRWLGSEVPNIRTKTGWECEQGHQWKTTFQSIQRGIGCPFCYGNAPKTPDDYYILAEERGFKWLGPQVPNTITRTSWECEQGHQWETRYNAIQRGHGCPFCAGKAPKTPADYHALAEKRDFCWSGPEVPNTFSKTGWECEQGHQWKTTFQSIQRGSGCPFCSERAPKTPDDYHMLAKERGFRWLGSEVPNTNTKTGWECEQGHQWKTTFQSIQRGIGCPFCFGNAPKMPDDYYILAKERGFKWLGPQVPNIKTRTSWECEQGHQWETRYNAIQKGRGCPFCARNQKTPID